MRLLVLDCAANACAAAILEAAGLEGSLPGGDTGGDTGEDFGDAHILAALSEAMTRGHAERIAPMLADCLDAAESNAVDLDAVAVTVGPGAFTGIRIGLAAARGFALAAHIPLLGVNCLEVAALPFRGKSPVLVALETKRADFYLQAFDGSGCAVTDPAALPVEEISGYLPTLVDVNQSWSVTGDGAERLIATGGGILPALRTVPAAQSNSAVDAGRIALAVIAARGLPPADDPGPRPLYLRPPDVNPNPPVSPLTRPRNDR